MVGNFVEDMFLSNKFSRIGFQPFAFIDRLFPCFLSFPSSRRSKENFLFAILHMQIQTDYKVINMDQWMGFFRFCNEVPHYLPKHTNTPCIMIFACIYRTTSGMQ